MFSSRKVPYFIDKEGLKMSRCKLSVILKMTNQNKKKYVDASQCNLFFLIQQHVFSG